MALEYLSGGTAVSNKAVLCQTAVTLNGTGYLMGRIKGLAAASVLGNTSASYGVWDGSGKTGQRKNVISTGVPGTTGEVLLDLQSGRMYYGTADTLYIYYWKYADLMNEGRIYQVNIPGALEGTVEDVYVDACPWDVKWGEYQISVDGNRPAGQTLTFGLHTATAGGGSGVTITFGATAVSATNGFLNIAGGGLAFDTGDQIVLRDAASNQLFSGIKVTLREILEQ